METRLNSMSDAYLKAEHGFIDFQNEKLKKKKLVHCFHVIDEDAEPQ